MANDEHNATPTSNQRAMQMQDASLYNALLPRLVAEQHAKVFVVLHRMRPSTRSYEPLHPSSVPSFEALERYVHSHLFVPGDEVYGWRITRQGRNLAMGQLRVLSDSIDDAVLRAFTVDMRAKLAVNRHKGEGGWRRDAALQLFDRMLQEASELRGELLRKERDPAAIRREAADVANFAMFVADVAEREAKGEG